MGNSYLPPCRTCRTPESHLEAGSIRIEISWKFFYAVVTRKIFQRFGKKAGANNPDGNLVVKISTRDLGEYSGESSSTTGTIRIDISKIWQKAGANFPDGNLAVIMGPNQARGHI